ncbi:phosphoribosylformylglycinamidine synthase subunit PurS, partial [uncultured Campylobacter sp.]
MKVIVNVRLKEGVLDPQGKAVKHALASLGFSGVRDVRVAKQIVLELDGEDRDKIYA